MIKISIYCLGLFLSFSSFSAEKYILVLFHGYGGPENVDIKERSKIPDYLSSSKVVKFYDGSHNVSEKKFFQVLDNFQCQNGSQNRKDLGLVIIGYSWGAKRAYDFSKEYLEKCGRKADRAYMIDGVLKLITKFPFPPIATVCKNWYKTINPIRGRPFKNCENFDKTELCTHLGGEYDKGFKCHQFIITTGTEWALKDIAQNLK